MCSTLTLRVWPPQKTDSTAFRQIGWRSLPAENMYFSVDLLKKKKRKKSHQQIIWKEASEMFVLVLSVMRPYILFQQFCYSKTAKPWASWFKLWASADQKAKQSCLLKVYIPLDWFNLVCQIRYYRTLINLFSFFLEMKHTQQDIISFWHLTWGVYSSGKAISLSNKIRVWT